jgi:hypothetical protein
MTSELYKAIYDNNKVRAVELITSGRVDVNHTDFLGYSPLSMACKKNDLSMVRLLLNYNATESLFSPKVLFNTIKYGDANLTDFIFELYKTKTNLPFKLNKPTKKSLQTFRITDEATSSDDNVILTNPITKTSIRITNKLSDEEDSMSWMSIALHYENFHAVKHIMDKGGVVVYDDEQTRQMIKQSPYEVRRFIRRKTLEAILPILNHCGKQSDMYTKDALRQVISFIVE